MMYVSVLLKYFYGPLASIKYLANYTLNLIKINNYIRSCSLIEAIEVDSMV